MLGFPLYNIKPSDGWPFFDSISEGSNNYWERNGTLNSNPIIIQNYPPPVIDIEDANKNLIVLGVPSNSFNQEKNNENEVKEFCEVNFNISFPMTSIFHVKGDNAHEIYKWALNNHGKSAIPKWNFHKILINKEGKIEDTFAPFTQPTSKKIIKKIESILN